MGPSEKCEEKIYECVRRNWDQTRDQTLSHLAPSEQKVARIEEKMGGLAFLAEESQLFNVTESVTKRPRSCDQMHFLRLSKTLVKSQD